MAFDATLGGSASNSYVSLEEAEQLLSALPSSPGIDDWLSFTDDEKGKSLIGATSVLDCLNWLGIKCSQEQRLNWPRQIYRCFYPVKCDMIPHQMTLATSYLAASMGVDGGFIAIESSDSTNLSSLDLFEEAKVGPIEVKIRNKETSEPLTNRNNIPPYVSDLIRPFLAAVGISQPGLYNQSAARAFVNGIAGRNYTGTMYLRDGVVYPRMGGWSSGMGGRF